MYYSKLIIVCNNETVLEFAECSWTVLAIMLDYSQSVPWLWMGWRRASPGHHQPWYWWTGPLWWRHQMETFSALLASCVGNSPVPGEFPTQRPVTRNFEFTLISARINGWVNNREAGDLRRHRIHYEVTVMCFSWGGFSTTCMYYYGICRGILMTSCSSYLQKCWEIKQNIYVFKFLEINPACQALTTPFYRWRQQNFLNDFIPLRHWLFSLYMSVYFSSTVCR